MCAGRVRLMHHGLSRRSPTSSAFRAVRFPVDTQAACAGGVRRGGSRRLDRGRRHRRRRDRREAFVLAGRSADSVRATFPTGATCSKGKSIVGALLGGLLGVESDQADRPRQPIDRRCVRAAADRRHVHRPRRLLPGRARRPYLRHTHHAALGRRFRRRHPAPSDAAL